MCILLHCTTRLLQILRGQSSLQSAWHGDARAALQLNATTTDNLQTCVGSGRPAGLRAPVLGSMTKPRGLGEGCVPSASAEAALRSTSQALISACVGGLQAHMISSNQHRKEGHIPCTSSWSPGVLLHVPDGACHISCRHMGSAAMMQTTDKRPLHN